MDRTAIIEQWKSETKPSEFAGDLNDPHLVDVLPIPISMPMPSIPSGSVERGKVVLDFVVSSAGDVGAIKVVESTSGRLSEIAIQIVSRWKYKPGRLNDKPVAVLLRIPLVF
jgi:protein TonB